MRFIGGAIPSLLPEETLVTVDRVDETTISSPSITISGSSLRLSSGKKPREAKVGQVVFLNDSDNEYKL